MSEVNWNTVGKSNGIRTLTTPVRPEWLAADPYYYRHCGDVMEPVKFLPPHSAVFSSTLAASSVSSAEDTRMIDRSGARYDALTRSNYWHLLGQFYSILIRRRALISRVMLSNWPVRPFCQLRSAIAIISVNTFVTAIVVVSSGLIRVVTPSITADGFSLSAADSWTPRMSSMRVCCSTVATKCRLDFR